MSNEYKDWIADFTPNQKVIYNICMEYPFLIPRDIDGSRDEDFEYEYLNFDIPNGWHKLFFQMCSDIKPLLVREGVLDDFYFLQVKEKYNELICYSNGIASKEVEDIIDKYKYMAFYVCTKCGKPAKGLTSGYIASFCEECWQHILDHKVTGRIDFKPYCEVINFSKDGHSNKVIYFEDEWKRYVKENGYET